MNVIPWRVRNFISRRLPLFYYFAANVGVKGNSAKHWDKMLEDTWGSPERCWPTKDALIASLTEPADVIIDIGCGDGQTLRFLKGAGYGNLHGLDISQYAVRRLESEGIIMHLGKLPAMVLPDSSFDVVIASQVLEHVIRRRFLMSEIRRVLKPEGRALIFVPDDCLGPIDEREHVTMFTAESLRKLVTKYLSPVTIRSMRDVNHEIPILFAHCRKPAANDA